MDTVLAATPEYLAEYQRAGRLLTIARRSDGHAVALTGPSVAGDFRDCLRTHTPERVCETFAAIAGADWHPLYKAHALAARLDELQAGGRP